MAFIEHRFYLSVLLLVNIIHRVIDLLAFYSVKITVVYLTALIIYLTLLITYTSLAILNLVN